MYRPVPTAEDPRGGTETESVEIDFSATTLDQVPRWIDVDQILPLSQEDSSLPLQYFSDPLSSLSGGASGSLSRFPLDVEVNSKIYLWRGDPWSLEVDAVVNSINEVSI